MDEILFHISQRLESLQVFIYSSLQSSRVFLQGYSENLNAVAIQSREILRSCLEYLNSLAINSRSNASWYFESAWDRIGPQIADAQEKFWLLIQWIRDLCNQILESLRHHAPSVQNAAISGTEGVSQRTSYHGGSLGFVLGCIVGLTLGLSWQQKSLPPAVCMKAVVATNYGGLDGLAFVEDAPSPRILEANEVMIEVIASSIDSTDISISNGYACSIRKLLGIPKFPVALGRDCAGVVVEVGRSVAWLTRGDEVWLALPPWAAGGMAELVVAPEQQVALKPKALGFEAAATVPYAALLAWDAAVVKAKLSAETAPGKRVLVRDAGSAVGCILVQLSRLWGAHVTAIVSARAKEVARQIGANDVLVATIDLDMELRSRPRFDIVFNTVGPAMNVVCRRACDPDGLVICTTPPVLPADSYGLILSSVHTLWVRSKCLFKGQGLITQAWGSMCQGRAILEQMSRLVEQGQIQPVLDRVFSVSDAELAFQHASSTNAVGKTVVHFRTQGRGRYNYGT